MWYNACGRVDCDPDDESAPCSPHSDCARPCNWCLRGGYSVKSAFEARGELDRPAAACTDLRDNSRRGSEEPSFSAGIHRPATHERRDWATPMGRAGYYQRAWLSHSSLRRGTLPFGGVPAHCVSRVSLRAPASPTRGCGSGRCARSTLRGCPPTGTSAQGAGGVCPDRSICQDSPEVWRGT